MNTENLCVSCKEYDKCEQRTTPADPKAVIKCPYYEERELE